MRPGDEAAAREARQAMQEEFIALGTAWAEWQPTRAALRLGLAGVDRLTAALARCEHWSEIYATRAQLAEREWRRAREALESRVESAESEPAFVDAMERVDWHSRYDRLVQDVTDVLDAEIGDDAVALRQMLWDAISRPDLTPT